MWRPCSWLGLVLCACASAPVVQPPPPATQLVDLEPQEFPGARGLLDGFDEPTDAADWQAGDRVLFGLLLRKGAEVHRWLLLLNVVMVPEPVRSAMQAMVDKAPTAAEKESAQKVLANWDSNFVRASWPYSVTTPDGVRESAATATMLIVGVRVCDADGSELGKSVIRLPADLLARGVLAAADLAIADAKASAAAASRGKLLAADTASIEAHIVPQVEAILAMLSLLRVVQEDDVLAQYFWQVVEKPSMWSVLTSLGVKANISMAFERSVEATALPAHLPRRGRAVAVPLRIDVNGSPALFADVLATDPRRPYALCGGMVAAAAHHPTDPDLDFDVVLLAARCAAGK